MRHYRASIGGLMAVALVGMAAGGCANKQSARQPAPVARTAEPVRPVVLQTSSGEMKAQCTVTPECPTAGKKGEQTTIRSAHTWTIDNPTAEARQFTVVLEITDDLGHAKKKEVPGEVKAHSKIDDSTSIALVTTYRESGAVQVQTKTTVRIGERIIGTATDTCRFDLP